MTRVFPTSTTAETASWRRIGVRVAMAVALGTLVAACGGGGSQTVASARPKSSTARPSTGHSRTSSGALFVSCLRAHGVPLLESAATVTDGQVLPQIPRGMKREYASAFQACAKDLPGRVGVEAKPFNVRDELAFAHCMRSQGITNFPDPSSDGSFTINLSTANQPRFEAAARACTAKPGFPGVHWDSAP